MLYMTGVICEVVEHETLESGRMNIQVVGKDRFFVKSVDLVSGVEPTTGEDAQYFMATVEPFKDINEILRYVCCVVVVFR